MDIFIYLIPCTILIASIALFGLIWAIKNGQYNDLKGQGNKIIFIDEKGQKNKK